MTTLTATELATEWILDGCQPEWVTLNEEGRANEAIFRFVLLDFDYEMAYLLRVTTVRSGGESTCSYLAVYQRHAGADDITVEWLPSERFDHRFFDPDHSYYQHDAAAWFVTWVYETFHECDGAPSDSYRNDPYRKDEHGSL